MCNDTLYMRLLEHKKLGYSSFHTPGHKSAKFFPEGFLDLDLTELPDTDALFESSGIIREAERKLARLFGSGASLISAGGCTLAIQAMLRIASSRGRKVLIGRNAHRSAVNTCALLGLDPVWIMPRSEVPFFTGTVRPEDVEAAFRENGSAAACYITSPDYYGELSDIKSIAEVCHRHGALLLVDNAHGSHLAFMQNDLHPIALGADMTACSMHKTLPVLTGGAALNIADPELFDECKRAMSLFGSTSPSYLIMASIDLCRSYLENGGKDEYRSFEEKTAKIKKLAADNGLTMPQGLCDPLRICINTSEAGVSGSMQEEYFHSYKIEPEFCDGANAVFICTPFNTDEDMQRLEKALSDLNVTPESKKAAARQPISCELPKKATDPRTALLAPSELADIEDAQGRICADCPCLCPPGIPILMPGEYIAHTGIKLPQPIRCVTGCK